MYEGVADPHCYSGTTVLKNLRGLRKQAALDRFETIATAQRAEEPLPAGTFDVPHYRAVYRHLFQDVYRWAGRFRTIRISKGESMFCYPEHIPTQMRTLIAGLRAKRNLHGLTEEDFASAAVREVRDAAGRLAGWLPTCGAI